MKKHGRRFLAPLLGVFIACLCAGCMTSVDELYSLPQMSEEYVQLQELIEQRIADGGAYAAPTGGGNRQTIQFRDLDGDGTAEALAFLVDGARTPNVCIYRQDGKNGYYPYIIIEGYGSGVASVDYADLNGDGASDLITAWQGGGDMRFLTVHSLTGEEQSQQELLSVDCTDFLVCDLDDSGTDDLLALQDETDGISLAMYSLDQDKPQRAAAPLSAGVTAVRRALAGSLSDGTPAVFLESDLGPDSLITDVFTASDGDLANITMSALGRSNTVRPSDIFAADMDGDQSLELPVGGGDILTWYSLDAEGSLSPSVSTYYNEAGGWYLVLTGPLSGDLMMERQDGEDESSITFTVMGDEDTPQGSVLIIYTLTGDGRLDRASADGRFVLFQDENDVYAAQLMTDALTEQDIMDNFHLINAEWRAGDL